MKHHKSIERQKDIETESKEIKIKQQSKAAAYNMSLQSMS